MAELFQFTAGGCAHIRYYIGDSPRRL